MSDFVKEWKKIWRYLFILAWLISPRGICYAADNHHAATIASKKGDATVEIETPHPLFSNGIETFAIQQSLKDKTVPAMEFLKDSFTARAINLANRNFTDGSTVKVTFTGLILTTDSLNPQELNVRLAGRSNEFSLPERLSKKDFLAGKKMTISLPEKKKSVAGYAISATGFLTFRLNQKTHDLEEVTARGEVKLGDNPPEQGRIEKAVGVRKWIKRLPLRSE